MLAYAEHKELEQKGQSIAVLKHEFAEVCCRQE